MEVAEEDQNEEADVGRESGEVRRLVEDRVGNFAPAVFAHIEMRRVAERTKFGVLLCESLRFSCIAGLTGDCSKRAKGDRVRF